MEIDSEPLWICGMIENFSSIRNFSKTLKKNLLFICSLVPISVKFNKLLSPCIFSDLKNVNSKLPQDALLVHNFVLQILNQSVILSSVTDVNEFSKLSECKNI